MTNPAPKQVTPEELKKIWMRDDAVSMRDDREKGIRVVGLEDGTEFFTNHADLDVTR